MTDDVDDSLLVDRARRGDREAFARLVDAQAPPLRKFLWRLGVAAEELDDLTQETFVTLVRALPDFRATSAFRTFLFGIAVNVVRRARRSRRTTTSLDDVDVAAPAELMDRTDRVELAARLRAAIARLPDAHREAFVLRHVEDLPAGEVARALDLPEGSVRRLVFEARERLRWMLDASRIEESPR